RKPGSPRALRGDQYSCHPASPWMSPVAFPYCQRRCKPELSPRWLPRYWPAPAHQDSRAEPCPCSPEWSGARSHSCHERASQPPGFPASHRGACTRHTTTLQSESECSSVAPSRSQPPCSGPPEQRQAVWSELPSELPGTEPELSRHTLDVWISLGFPLGGIV